MTEESTTSSQATQLLLGQYQLNAVCGEGSTSIVYEATHTILNRTLAVKVLRQECSDRLSMQAFQCEAQTSSSLPHPNIVAACDCGMTTSGQPFIVSEYVPGGSLADRIKQSQSLPNNQVIEIFIQICAALEYVHKRGFVHRSVNVTKIMFEKPGDKLITKLIGFSRAKKIKEPGNEIDNLANSGQADHQARRFSLYMSPEHAHGKEVDGRADIYATGCTMYQALTGEIPLKGENVYHTIQKHLTETPVPMAALRRDLKINKDLENIVSKAMQKDPSDRFQSMSEMVKALEKIRR